MKKRERPHVPRVLTPLSTPAVASENTLRFPLLQSELTTLVRSALEEDRAFDDVTTIATVVSGRRSRAVVVARQKGVIAGIPLALEAFRLLDPKVTIRVDVEDGGLAGPGRPVLFISGHSRALLSAERVALNFLQRLSGIATATRSLVDAVAGTKARILDTRKTTPGWRALEKYAVRAGGGKNHRMDLATGVLIKDNHLSAVDGDVALAIRRARELVPPGTSVEVECDRAEQVEAAVEAGADIIMLDNMTPDQMRACVERVAGRAIMEASGGVTAASIRAIAATGVDWISVGALTHSPRALDLGLDFEPV